MSVQIISRTSIMLSALEAVRDGKTIDDCPHVMQPYLHTWQYEFTEAQRKLGLTSTETTLQGE